MLPEASPSPGGLERNYASLSYVFSEQGVAMLSSVLRSDRAIAVNVTSIVRAIRELATPSESKPKRRIGFVSEE